MPDSPVQKITTDLIERTNISLYIKREDLLHPLISGNKYRKLKYNLVQAKKEGYRTLLTFGGAYSNHIAAVARAGAENAFETLGVIRGDELEGTWQKNPTLAQAHADGMRFIFVSREAYRQKETNDFLMGLQKEYGPFYLLPEGGTNALAVQGCTEILKPSETRFKVICCPVGTGGTVAGIINASLPHQRVIGFSALKGDFLIEDIRKFAIKENWSLQTDYHFGGYGKVSAPLVRFINRFKADTNIPLDPVYTGKMLYGLVDLINQGYFREGSEILAIHTGGLQGITGMNQRLKMKNLPCIDF